MKKYVAVLSTTVLPLDGNYSVKAVEVASIHGVPHYIGHPATKMLIEALGAVEAPSKLFDGLQVGDTAICFSIKQGMSSRKELGHTVHQEVNADALVMREITRLPDTTTCGFCGCEHVQEGWHCPACGAN